jgi:PIN domain nuclease of toxin-antitoxin system
MKLLLDTHAFLWFIMGDPRLSATARSLIEDENNEKLLSVASLWEMAIKVSIGKLSLAEPFDVLVPREIKQNGFQLLGIDMAHTAVVAALPLHHRDPFDRLLIAQAKVEQVPIIGADSVFDAYLVKRLW